MYTACNNMGCPQSSQCCKFMTTPSERQSTITFQYEVSANGIVCEHFKSIWKTYESYNTYMKDANEKIIKELKYVKD